MVSVMRFFLITLALCLSFPQNVFAADSQSIDKGSASKTVILIRHAEKEAGKTKDPSLSDRGRQRAHALIDKLDHQPLSLLLASPYKRTQETLLPLSQQRKLPIVVIKISGAIEQHINAITEAVEANEGNVLIAGHSNTVPLIIAALGGPSLNTIDENQYSTIYSLTLYQSGKVELDQQSYFN